MPDQEPIHDPSERHRTVQLEILYAITKPDDNPFVWSMEELGRELSGDEIEPAIVSLLGAGLIHRTSDGFIFASRAAIHQIELVGYGVF
jgi:hypothetical protein